MQLDQNPFFRKTITPWYDSNLACWIVMGGLIFVLFFSITGIFVGVSNPAFAPHVWFPVFLTFLCLFLIIKIYLRMKRRDKNN